MKNIFTTHCSNLVKGALIVIVLLSSAHYSYGQDKKDLTITLSSGVLNSPYYQKAKAEDFYGIDFGYQLSKKNILSVNYFAGGHKYYEDILSNNPGSVSSADGTNSKADYRSFSVMYKYNVINLRSINIVPGVGAGIMTHTRSYPYQEPGSSYTRISSWSDLVFPVSLDLNFKISKKWQTGVTSGFLIHPDFPILALHAGPKLSYIIK